MKTLELMSLALLCALNFGCDDNADAEEAGPVTMEALSLETAKAICHHQEECCPSGDEATCIQLLSAVLQEGNQQGVDANFMSFDGDAAGQCLSAIKARIAAVACGEDPFGGAIPASCKATFTGNQALGETCEIDLGDNSSVTSNNYCTGDLFCASDSTCQAYLAQGGDCGMGNQECAEGLECLSGTCTPLGEIGGACEAYYHCIEGLTCLDGMCATLIADGETCRVNDNCAEGLRCNVDVCAPRFALGEDCQQESDCLSESCDFGTEKCVEKMMCE